MYYVPVCTQKRLLTGYNNIRKSRNPAAVMGVLDAVADVRKNTGGKCIININNFRASVYSNIFESLGANWPMITVRKFSHISY
jgi:hypothetical protein